MSSGPLGGSGQNVVYFVLVGASCVGGAVYVSKENLEGTRWRCFSISVSDLRRENIKIVGYSSLVSFKCTARRLDACCSGTVRSLEGFKNLRVPLFMFCAQAYRTVSQDRARYDERIAEITSWSTRISEPPSKSESRFVCSYLNSSRVCNVCLCSAAESEPTKGEMFFTSSLPTHTHTHNMDNCASLIHLTRM